MKLLKVLTWTIAGLAGVGSVLPCGLTKPAQAAKFLGLGDLADGSFFSLASGLSANGSVVVGLSDSASGGEAFRWTSVSGLVGLGDLAGGSFNSHAFGVSDDGSVVVGLGDSASGGEAFRWTSVSGLVGLGDLAGGSFNSHAFDVSADGSVVVGRGANSMPANEAFRWTSASGLVGLGDLAGGAFSSSASGVSADGSVVVGRSSSASGTEAFRWTSGGGLVGLGDLAGGAFFSSAFDVSADGSVVVGTSTSASGNEAFRWTSGSGLVGLGDLAGGSFFSIAGSVSADGSVVVGESISALGSEPFIWDEANGMRKVKDVLSPSVGAALNGWTLSFAVISADGRTIVGGGTNPSGNTEGWIAYMEDATFWFPEVSGDWDSSLNWSGPFLPGPADDVVIDPSVAITVDGPSANKTVNSLKIGDEDGIGRVALRLTGAANGDLRVTGGALIWHNAELVLADGRTFSASSLDNHGVVRGTGAIDVDLNNRSVGELRVASGESLVVVGGSHANYGKIEAIGGSLEFIGPVTNNVSTGLITGRSSTLRFQNGLSNNGSLMLTFGTSDVSGDVTNSATGKIIVAGGGAATFYDDVTQNGTLQVIKVGSTNSTAVFAGAFTGSGGSSGGGDIFFLGDTRPGNSPAIVNFGNNIGFGPTTTLEIELGGTTPGSGYDRVHVAGSLTLGGTLDVNLVDLGTGTFAPQAGNSFDILDWVALSGTFDAINLPMLDESLTWDTSQLYTTGVLAVVAPGLAGDYNQNGVVDAADYTVWRDTGGTQTGYDTWQANFGRVLGSGAHEASAVPEPATLALLLVVSLLLAVNRSGRASTDLRS